MPCLTITVSPPAGGKTTWANNEAQKGNTVVACRDDFRAMLFGGLSTYNYSKEKERLVTQAQETVILAMLSAGKNVIVADTHCKAKYIQQWKQFAKDNGASFKVKDFVADYFSEHKANVEMKGVEGVMDSYLKRCLKWNLNRANSVPESVIHEMMQNYTVEIMKYIVPQHTFVDGAEKAVLFDIDGTLAHMLNLRSPFDWKRVGVDVVDEIVRRTLDLYRAAGYKIIVMSGRDGVCRSETELWLTTNNIHFDELWMRAEGDQRHDGIVKQELFMNHVQGRFNVEVVFDDRDRVVVKWREMGLKVYQVAEGNF